MVLLNPGLSVDDHADLDISGMGVHRTDRLMMPDQNLDVQTEVISRARAFVGTYGGLAYLGRSMACPRFRSTRPKRNWCRHTST